MKPFSSERLHAAVERARGEIERQLLEGPQGHAARLLEDIQRERAYPEWLLIKKDERSVFLARLGHRLDRVLAQQRAAPRGQGRSTSTTRRRPASSRSSIRRSSCGSTARRSCNIEKIKEMHPWFNGDYAVTLKDGTRLTLSSTYRERLKEFRRLAV